jgi:hypothetical protein
MLELKKISENGAQIYELPANGAQVDRILQFCDAGLLSSQIGNPSSPATGPCRVGIAFWFHLRRRQCRALPWRGVQHHARPNFLSNSNDAPLCSIGHIGELSAQRMREKHSVPG